MKNNKLIFSLIFGASLFFAINIYLFSDYSPTYLFRIIQVKRLDDTVNGIWSCDNNYSWQVITAASTSSRNLFEGVGGDLTVFRKLQLIKTDTKNVIPGDHSFTSPSPYLETESFFNPLIPFQKAYLLPEVRAASERFPTAWTKEKYYPSYGSSRTSYGPYWSFYYVDSRDIPERDFDLIANCLKKNLTEINDTYTTIPSENTNRFVNSKHPLGGLILQNKAHINHLYTTYTCNNGSVLKINQMMLQSSTSQNDLVGGVVIDLKGNLFPQVYVKNRDADGFFSPKEEVDELAFKEFEIIKEMIDNKQCVNQYKDHLKELIQSLPRKIDSLR